MKIYAYGILYNTKDEGDFRKIRTPLATANAKAFAELRSIDRFTKSQFDIMVNEASRGRLNTYNINAVYELADMIRKIMHEGYTTRDIVVLRSIGFNFDDILKKAKRREMVSDIVKNSFDEDDIPDIEVVYGVTSMCVNKLYVPYNEIEGVNYYEEIEQRC